uniref:Cadherin domain-containing protein n=1 Tax=Rhabditophanes sp. KR3021 TaxID=114890 RepID=A0AC35U0C6_9BILA
MVLIPSIVQLLVPLYLSSIKISWCPEQNINIRNSLFAFTILEQTRNFTYSYDQTSFLLQPEPFNPKSNDLTIECSTNLHLIITINNSSSLPIKAPHLCDQTISSTPGNFIFYDHTICLITFDLVGLAFDLPAYEYITSITQNNSTLLQNSCSGKRLSRYSINGKIQPIFPGTPIKVKEGGRYIISWRNLYAFPEHKRFGLETTDILFRVIEPPSHGQLLFVGSNRIADKFDYDMIINNQIEYQHDGSETFVDGFDLYIEINSASSLLKEQVDLSFKSLSMAIEIESVNDAPLLELVKNTPINIALGSKLVLSQNIISLSDADNSADSVTIQVLESSGVDLVTNDNVQIDIFTQSQFINQQIFIKDDGRHLSEKWIKLRGKDSDASSDIIKIIFILETVDIRLIRNSGIKVAHRGNVLIGPNNLTASTNVKGICTLKYNVVEKAQFGNIECVSGNGKSNSCTEFSQNDIDSEKVKFRHTKNTSLDDFFKVKIYCGSTSSHVFTINVQFIPITIKIFHTEPLLLNNTEQSVVKRSHLLVSTFPNTFDASELVYHIVEPPKYGILSRKLNTTKSRRIGVHSNFTQEHLNEGVINYKLHFVQFSVVNDYFTFKLITPAKTSELTRFDITYIPDAASIKLINLTISVKEGSAQQIPKTSLWLETSDDNDFTFTVALPPSNGKFVLTDLVGTQYELSEMNTFSSSDITSGRLYYQHDGSEEKKDEVYVIAESIYKGNTKIPFWMTFHIISQNDNAPTIIDPNDDGAIEIYLVTKKQKTLKSWMLAFEDEDGEYIHFTFKFLKKYKDFLIHTSNLFSSQNFTNKQLTNDGLTIEHVGNRLKSSNELVINDGIHSTNVNILFIASPPFIRLYRNIISYDPVWANKLVLIRRQNLTAITNLDVDLDDIKIEPLENDGFLMLIDNKFVKCYQFSQSDINENLIFFDLNELPKDNRIIIQMTVQDLKNISTLYLDKSFRHVPADKDLILNEEPVLNVTFASMQRIDESIVDVVALPRLKEKVIFKIINGPMYGKVIMQISQLRKHFKRDGPSNISSKVVQANVNIMRFTAADLAKGKIYYVHDGKELDKSVDFVVFNITMGSKQYGPFKLVVNVKYDALEKVSTNISLDPNGKKSIREMMMPFYHLSNDEPVKFLIISYPRFGKVTKQKGELVLAENLVEFDDTDLAEDSIYYTNSDISDITKRDKLVVRVCPSFAGKCELDVIIDIWLLKSNEKVPEIIKNEQLRVWDLDSPTTIPGTILTAEDEDTSNDNLVFSISKLINGKLTLDNKTTKSFTQADLSSGKVQFTLTQNTTGGFSFVVSDGARQVGPEWFNVEKTVKSTVVLENNIRLVVAPGSSGLIDSDLFKISMPQVDDRQIVINILRQPKYGRLIMNKKIIYSFTQADIYARQVYYESNEIRQKVWNLKDYFVFNVTGGEDLYTGSEKFRILVTYAVVPLEKMFNFVVTKDMVINSGGSIVFNKTNINLEEFVRVLNKEKLALEILKQPKHGKVSIFKGKQSPMFLSGDELLNLDKYLIFENKQTVARNDEVWFSICPLNELQKRATKMKIRVGIKITEGSTKGISVKHIVESITLPNSNYYTLSEKDLLTTHPHLSPTNIFYAVLRNGSNGVNVWMDGAKAVSFTQADVNKKLVKFSHEPINNERFDIISIKIGDKQFMIKVFIDQIEYKLTKNADITYSQGKTYALLNQNFLDVDYKGDRSHVLYTISKPPVNGTFYWVNDDKEATNFTQKNIDEGDILYAQLNMYAYKDSFSFNLGDSKLKEYETHIRVIPTITTNLFVLEGGTMANIDEYFLNASSLLGLSPRFYVSRQPLKGNLVLNGVTPLNESINFFTFVDVKEHRLFFDAFDTNKQIIDEIELELRGDSIQPARFNWSITITPTLLGALGRSNDGAVPKSANSTTNIPKLSVPKIQSDSNSNHIQIFIGALVVIIIMCIFFCRKSSKEEPAEAINQPNLNNPNLYRSLEALQLAKQLDTTVLQTKSPTFNLLENTVYAKIGSPKVSSISAPQARNISTFTSNYESLPFKTTSNSLKGSGSAFVETPKKISEVPGCRIYSLPSQEPMHKSTSDISGITKKSNTSKKEQYWV